MSDHVADEVAVRTVMAAWAQALRDKNAAGVTVCQAEGMVLYGLAPPLVSGASTRWLQAWFDTWDGPIGYELADMTVAVGGDIAFSHGLSHMTGKKMDGEVVDLWFRHTLGLRRQGGGWKVVHEHESVPFRMDGSFKAAVDLKP